MSSFLSQLRNQWISLLVVFSAGVMFNSNSYFANRDPAQDQDEVSNQQERESTFTRSPAPLVRLLNDLSQGLDEIPQPDSANAPQDKASALVNYKLDPAHTSLVFAVNHYGLSYVYGRFNECTGDFSLNGKELTSKGFSFTIQSDSIDTNQKERDAFLQGPDFFDSQQFPEIKFVTTGIEKKGDSVNVTGDFTMHGKTKQIMLPMQMVGIGKGPFGKQRAGYFTRFTIKRSDFGMEAMKGQVGNNISITFSFEGVKSK